LAAAYLQIVVTLGLVLLCGVLHRRYQKRYFGLWAVAWAVYGLRLGAIVTFLHTGAPAWLFWHQVTTGSGGVSTGGGAAVAAPDSANAMVASVTATPNRQSMRESTRNRLSESDIRILRDHRGDGFR
jgi:hypothetical protein